MTVGFTILKMSCSNERMAGVGVNRVRINTRESAHREGSAWATRSATLSVPAFLLFVWPSVRADFHAAAGETIRKYLFKKET